MDMLVFEKEAWNSGLFFIAGVDEAGRGPLAGPVVAAAVAFEREPLGNGSAFAGLTDSKALEKELAKIEPYLKKFYPDIFPFDVEIKEDAEHNAYRIVATTRQNGLSVTTLRWRWKTPASTSRPTRWRCRTR